MPVKTVEKQSAKTLSHYAQYFNLSELDVLQGRTQKISTVHHDETGRITHID